jgi:hypothetical protein
VNKIEFSIFFNNSKKTAKCPFLSGVWKGENTQIPHSKHIPE